MSGEDKDKKAGADSSPDQQVRRILDELQGDQSEPQQEASDDSPGDETPLESSSEQGESIGDEADDPDDSMLALVAGIDTAVEELDSADHSQAETGSVAEGKYFLFSLGSARFGISIDSVEEMGLPPEVTHLPGTPLWLLGVTNLRGDVLAVVDLASFFALKLAVVEPSSRRFVIVRGGEPPVRAGLLVGEVMGIREIEEYAVATPMGPVDDRIAATLEGCCEVDHHIISVLAIDRLLPKLLIGDSDIAD